MADNIKPDPAIVQCITNMPPLHTDIQQLQSLLAMINFMQLFVPHISPHTGPLRELLKKILHLHAVKQSTKPSIILRPILSQLLRSLSGTTIIPIPILEHASCKASVLSSYKRSIHCVHVQILHRQRDLLCINRKGVTGSSVHMYEVSYIPL